MITEFEIIDDIYEKVQSMPISSSDFHHILNTLIETISEKYNEIDYKYKDGIGELEQDLADLPLEAIKLMGGQVKDSSKHGESKGISKIIEDFQKTNKISYIDYHDVRDNTKQSLAAITIVGGILAITGVGTLLWKKKKERYLREKIAEYRSTYYSHLKEKINALIYLRQICIEQKTNSESIQRNELTKYNKKNFIHAKKVSYTTEIVNNAILKIDSFLSDENIVELIK